MNAAQPSRRLDSLPLWRLLVMLDDAERLVGPDSESVREIAKVVQQKLRTSRDGRLTPELEAAHAR